MRTMLKARDLPTMSGMGTQPVEITDIMIEAGAMELRSFGLANPLEVAERVIRAALRAKIGFYGWVGDEGVPSLRAEDV